MLGNFKGNKINLLGFFWSRGFLILFFCRFFVDIVNFKIGLVVILYYSKYMCIVIKINNNLSENLSLYVVIKLFFFWNLLWNVCNVLYNVDNIVYELYVVFVWCF